MRIKAFDRAEFKHVIKDSGGDVTFHCKLLSEAEAEPFMLTEVKDGGITTRYTDFVEILRRKVNRIDGLTLEVGGEDIPITSGEEFCKYRDVMPVVKDIIFQVAGEIVARSKLTAGEVKN